MLHKNNYSIDEIKKEAYQLVECGAIDNQSPIWMLCDYIAPDQCVDMEEEIEKNHYLLRASISQLL